MLYRACGMFCAGALVLVGLSGCPSQRVSATDDLAATAALSPGGTLKVISRTGAIEVTTWNQSTVALEATRTVELFAGPFNEPGDPEDFLDDIDVTVTGGGDEVEIMVDWPENWALSGLLAGVDLELLVPAGAAVEIEHRNGPVEIDGVEGGIDLDLGNGQATLDDVDGDMDISVGAGAVDLDHPRVPLATAQIRVEVGTGEIVFSLPEESAFEIEADVSIGGITIDDFPITPELGGTGASVFAVLGEGGARIDLEVGVGNIGLDAL